METKTYTRLPYGGIEVYFTETVTYRVLVDDDKELDTVLDAINGGGVGGVEEIGVYAKMVDASVETWIDTAMVG
jgi:hypothetical protein